MSRRQLDRLRILALGCAVCASLLLPAATAWAAKSAGWIGPSLVTASPDGKLVIVACPDAQQILVVDVAANKVAAKIAVPAEPTGLVFHSGRLYVTCAAPQSTVCVIDVASKKIVASLPAGHTAIAPAVSPDGKRLYVCNRFNNTVSVFDLASGKETAQIAAVREPYATALSPCGKTLFVANHLPNDPADSYDVACRITVVDTANNKTSTIRLLNGSSGIRGMALAPDGKRLYVTHILARYQMPTTQLERGWMNTNALSIIDAEQKKLINTVLLDDVDLGAAVPWGVACTADGQTVCVSHAGTHELSVINIAGVMEKLAKLAAPPAAAPAPAAGAAPAPSSVYASSSPADVPNDLAFLVDLRQRIPLSGNGPRGVAVIGTKAYVVQYFTDSLAVVDLAPKAEKPVATLALGPAPKMTVQRRGEMLFNDAKLCFQHWQSCASCHPDSRVDALNWDLMNDGLGNPKNNKSMLHAHKTPPSMWAEARPTAESAVRSGLTHILFAVRPEEEADAIDDYLKSLEPVPSPYLVGGQLSAKAQRGKLLFHSEQLGCAKCHPEPYYTDQRMHDVNSEGPYDRRTTFDTPGLVECWRTAPYLHDGRYTTVKDLLLKGKHVDHDGHLSKLTPEQIDELVEFVLSL
jgi:YVTN family beta-propeller protein